MDIKNMNRMENAVSTLNTSSTLHGTDVLLDNTGELTMSEVEAESFSKKLEHAAKNKDKEGLRQASREFEAYFLNLLLKQMRNTVIGSDLIEKSQARKTFEQMLDHEYAKAISKEDGIGLGKVLYEAMKNAYE